ncbi:MAG: phosphoenolpyruvate--protein phosphotransferase [Deltaproteobacteria bacterium]|nr:phosphoenolpyruvate--protein phosphotransferase [Deltaproteobacteria bacterium]
MPRRRPKTLQGIDASPGIHVGLVHLVDRRRMQIPKVHIPDEGVEAEIERFRHAVEESIQQMELVREKVVHGGGKEPVAIIDAHIMIMRDRMLVEGAERIVRSEAVNAEWALQKIVAEIRQVFDAIEDDYFRERRSDVEFVGERIQRTLMGQDSEVIPPKHERAVVVARDLSPADTAGLSRKGVAALVTEVGGKTGHTAIVARALEIPAVVGVEGILARVGSRDRIIVDGYRGQVVLDPSEQMVRDALARSQGLRSRAAKIASERALPARTTDGHSVRLSANIEMADEVESALRYGAESIGLFRTEFLFMGTRAPTEGAQRKVYSRVLKSMSPRPATIRTMDLGGDKGHQMFGMEHEANPALGLRSIRLSLRHQRVFLAQLRALLRASVDGQLRILFPMISCRSEILQAMELLEEARRQLRQKGQAFADDIQVGMMIEVPSAAFMSAMFAKEVDYFSIGTNDLIQYTLAVDRHNEQVAYLYNPLHISVLRLLKLIVDDAHAAGIWVSMCGEMAGDPLFLPILLGLGLDEISMNPLALPFVRHMVRHSKVSDARRLTRSVMKLGDSQQTSRAVREFMAEQFPDFFTPAGHTDLLGGL